MSRICFLTLLFISSIIGAKAQLAVSVSPSGVSKCPLEELTLNATARNGDGTYTYRWYVRDQPSITIGTGPEIIITSQGLKAGLNYVHVEVTSGTEVADNFGFIGLKSSMEYELVDDTVTCGGDTIRLEGETNTANVSYRWNTNVVNPISQNTDQASYLVNKPGKYWVTVNPPPATILCPTADTVIVSSTDVEVDLIVSNSNPCDGETVLIKNVAPISSNATYSWNTGAMGSEILVKSSGTYRLNVVDQNQPSCVGGEEVVIDFTTKPLINLGPSQSTCGSDTVILKNQFANNPNLTYLWTYKGSGDIVLPQDSIITTSTPGKYFLTLMTQNSACRVIDSVLVRGSSLEVILPGDTAFCNQSDFIIAPVNTLPNNVTYNWSTGSTNSSINVDATGEYVLTISSPDLPGCSSSESIEVVFYDEITFDIDSPIISDTNFVIINAAERTSPQPGSLYSYLWSDDEKNEISKDSIVEIVQSGIYALSITNPALNCSGLFEFEVKLKEEELPPVKIFIPTAFSPSTSVKESRYFKIFSQGLVQRNFSLKVYNQWGQIVYENNSLEEIETTGWDGQTTNGFLMNGSYVYTVNAMTNTGESFTKSGSITFVR